MNIIFFDDNSQDLDLYKSLGTKFLCKDKCFFYSSVIGVKRYLSFHTTPSLFFLDIVVEGEPVGLHLAELIYGCNLGHRVVFITGYPEIVRYHSKYKLLADNIICKNSKLLSEEIAISTEYFQQMVGEKFISYKISRTEYHRIPISQILFAETIKRQSKIVLHLKYSAFTVQDTLLSLEKKLTEYLQFMRCHHSYFVNVEEIAQINTKSRELILSNNSICSYSKPYERELMRKWKLAF